MTINANDSCSPPKIVLDLMAVAQKTINMFGRDNFIKIVYSGWSVVHLAHLNGLRLTYKQRMVQ